MKREEQIRSAAFYASTKNDDYKKYAKDGIARMFFVEGAMFADANQPSPWISVEDKLPDDGVLVIVAHRWILGEILYASDVFHIDYGWESYDDVVAWMPIPELPKEV
jgi:hypothetical protein